MLALVVHAVIDNKYVAHAAMVVFYLFGIFQDRLGLEHTLFKYGDHPQVTYSDMNGFGHFVRPMVDLRRLLGRRRGDPRRRGLADVEARRRGGLQEARRRSPGRGISRSAVLVATAGLAVFAAAGGVVVYNTLVLHHYRTSKAEEALQADYEKKYKRIEGAPLPRITGVGSTSTSSRRGALDAHGT